MVAAVLSSSWQRALVPLYRLGQRIDRAWKSARRPGDLESARIVVVGNLTAGGSGKTPLVIRLCEVLDKAGLRPGVVSRGYGRKSTKLRLVSPSSDPSVVGDEPLLIARRTGVPVIVAEDRCEAARRLLQQGVQVVVSDDGLQHYRLPRRIEICVVDGARDNLAGAGLAERIHVEVGDARALDLRRGLVIPPGTGRIIQNLASDLHPMIAAIGPGVFGQLVFKGQR